MGSRTPPDRDAFLASLPRPFAAAVALVTDTQGRVLLLASYRPWLQGPGGVIEVFESPADCAQRELAEETGLELPAGALLAVCWVTAAGTSIADMHGVHLYFDMGTIDSSTPLTLQEDEIDSAEWEHPDDLTARMGPARAERFHAALAARADGRTRMVLHSRAELGPR
jgi:8-oxo-dGTP pyrophosphatase MutT (NUDIX family)